MVDFNVFGFFHAFEHTLTLHLDKIILELFQGEWVCVEFGQETAQPFDIVLKLNRDALRLSLQTFPEGFRVVFSHGGVKQTLERRIKARRVVEDIVDPIGMGSRNILNNRL